MRKILEVVILTTLVLAGFTGMAWAAGVPADDSGLIELAKPVLDAIVHGQWWLAAAAALVVSVAAVRRYADKLGPFGRAVQSEPGIIATTFAISFGGAVTTALVAAGPAAIVSLALFSTAAKVAAVACGGWAVIHKLATWAVATDFYKSKVPGWLQSVIAAILALIGSNAIAKAEAAGDKAVKENPPAGPDASNGNFTTF